MKKYIIELIGTFFLVLVIGLTANPIAIGAILLAMIFMGGHKSGAHYNPAVTLAILIRKKIETNEAIMYMVFQVLGAILAAIIYYMFSSNAFYPKPSVDYFQAIILETIFTFALASVVLNVATTKKCEGNSFYGLAIGFTVMASAFAIGPLSGGALNPAVALGTILVDTFRGGDSIRFLPIFLIGPFLGGALAAVFFRYINSEEFDESK